MPKSADQWAESLLYVASRAWALLTGGEDDEYDREATVSYESFSNEAQWWFVKQTSLSRDCFIDVTELCNEREADLYGIGSSASRERMPNSTVQANGCAQYPTVSTSERTLSATVADGGC